MGEILQADLGGGAQDADGADELSAHAVMLVTEDMLDPRTHLCADLVGGFLTLGQRFAPAPAGGCGQGFAIQPQRLGVGNGVLKPEANEPHERQPVAQLIFRLIVRQLVKRLQHQRLEDQHFAPRLAPGGTLVRAASAVRSPPATSAAFNLGRNSSNGTAAKIATRGSCLASSPS